MGNAQRLCRSKREAQTLRECGKAVRASCKRGTNKPRHAGYFSQSASHHVNSAADDPCMSSRGELSTSMILATPGTLSSMSFIVFSVSSSAETLPRAMITTRRTSARDVPVVRHCRFPLRFLAPLGTRFAASTLGSGQRTVVDDDTTICLLQSMHSPPNGGAPPVQEGCRRRRSKVSQEQDSRSFSPAR